MVDAIFAYPDGRRAALEITSDEHEAARQQAERLADDNWTYSIAGLKQGWYVRVSLDSRINQLEKDLLGILGPLEAAGIAGYEPDRWARSISDVDRLAIRHGLKANVIEGSPAGEVFVSQAAWGSTADSDPAVVSRWVATFLTQRLGKRKAVKLRDHKNVDERHLFIWATSRSDLGVRRVLSRDIEIGVDTEAPSLPDGVSHVWVGAARGVVAWFPDRGWWRTSWRWTPSTASGE